MKGRGFRGAALTEVAYYPGTKLFWNGAGRPTVLLSENRLLATIPASDIATPGVARVSVYTSYILPTGASNALSFRINAPGAEPCTYVLSPNNMRVSSLGGVRTVRVAASPGCAWTATTEDSWTSFDSETLGSGDGEVAFSIRTGGSAGPRNGVVVIGGQTVGVTQDGPILLGLNPGTVTAGSPAFTLNIDGIGFRPGRTYSPRTSADPDPASLVRWNGDGVGSRLVSSNRLEASVTADQVANPGVVQITVSNPPGSSFYADGGTSNTLVLTIQPSDCSYTISPQSLTVSPGAGGATVSVSAPPGCVWNATSIADWITVSSPGAGEGSRDGEGTVSFAFTRNTSRAQRAGSIIIAGIPFTLVQGGNSLVPAPVPSLFNAASFVRGSSPGSLATVFGSNLIGGSGLPVQAESLPLPLQLGGTSVELDGIPAPLLVLARVGMLEQINFQVPFELQGRASANLVVRRDDVSSASVRVSVLNAHPGVFTFDGSSGAVLHASTNEVVTASNPARSGEVVSVYATGLGPVTNAPPTGTAALADPLSRTLNPPTATITFSRLPAEVLFSGLAPGLVGLYQLNLRIPEITYSGSVPLVITSQGISSEPVNIAVAPKIK